MPITFAEIQKHDNGAQFFAADLHIHTYAVSEDVPDQALTVEAVIEEAVRLGISIISITDHNSSKNTEASVEYGRKYAGTAPRSPGRRGNNRARASLGLLCPRSYRVGSRPTQPNQYRRQARQ